MAIDKKLEIKKPERDPRSVDQRIGAFFSATPTTLICFIGMAVAVFLEPWLHHVFGLIALMWWAAVAFDRKRQVLPYALPRVAQRTDYNDPAGGGSQKYNKASGIIFLGNAHDRFYEVWETSSQARQHHLVIGTTGSGKSVMLTGLYINFILLGAGCIFSDAKGTKEQVSALWNGARRFGRDVDFFSINYSTGGMSVREARRDRLSHRCNPCSFATTDQINQMFMSFLPKSSGENQIFQDKAITMFSSLTPALVDRRDLFNEPLHIPKIRNYISSLQRIMDLALDQEERISPKSRDILANYLGSLPNFDWNAFLAARKAKVNYEIHAEAFRMFSYAQNYFTRALNSLSDTYGHIYNYESGEADYLDIVLNRRICVISLPALEKAPTELGNLAKINLSNLRGAIAFTTGQRVEGLRAETLDNLPSTSEVPTGIILDEYGYQATDGFAITLAQARSLGFSITVAGQDLANLKMGGESEFDGIFGNAILIVMKIRNLKDIGDRVRETVGEADVAVDNGLELSDGVFNGYRHTGSVSLQRRARLSPPDLLRQNTGEAILLVGGDMGFVKYFTFAPLPKPAEEFRLNRFLPISFEDEHKDERIDLSNKISAWVRGRLQGERSAPATQNALPSASFLPMWQAIHTGPKRKITQADWDQQVRLYLDGQITPGKPSTEARSITSAEAPTSLLRPRSDHGGAGGGGFRRTTRPDPLQEESLPPPASMGARPAPQDPIDPEDIPVFDGEGAAAAAETPAGRPPSRAYHRGGSAPVTGFGLETPVSRSMIPIREDLDRETEDDQIGDFNDLNQIPVLEGIGSQLDSAREAFNPREGSRPAGGPMAQSRDMVAGVKETAAYRPLESSPTSQVPLAHIVKQIAAVKANGQNRKRLPNQGAPDST